MDCAVTGPSPLMSPLPRNLTIPSSLEGEETYTFSAVNCLPYMLRVLKSPSTRRFCPSLTGGIVPTTVKMPSSHLRSSTV